MAGAEGETNNAEACSVPRRWRDSWIHARGNRSGTWGSAGLGSGPAIGHSPMAAALRRILVEHFSADIGPEFLQFVGQAVVQNQKSKCCGVSRCRPVSGHMVDIGDCCRRRLSARFRVVEMIIP